MRSDRWHTSPVPYATVRILADAIGTSDILATVLARRGYRDPTEAADFLAVDGVLHDPFLFPQMDEICARLREAIGNGEHICVHGDYDVDGITATALLVDVLRRLGARVDYHLPNRFREGYGIARQTVEAIANGGATLLLTVDCGIGAREQLERGRELGLESIVIDHHRPVEDLLPDAAIISPLLCDYPFKELAGVGLAFKLAQALLIEEQPDSGELPLLLADQLDLVALGTIADVVPLLDENRVLVKRGLPRLGRGSRPGIRALMQVSQVEPSRINTGTVAFRLAPRLNAAGRLDDPTPALELLLAEEEQPAMATARELDSLNRERQRIENAMLGEAQELLGKLPEELKAARGYVISSPGWHEGVIGIVAAKMVESHYRPVILISEQDDQGKGSGRSIPAFDLHGSLLQLEQYLERFGGHRAACGLTIALDEIDSFRRSFAELANSTLEESDLKPSHYVDAIVSGRELTLELAEELSLLEPYGMGNPSIDLLAAGARIINGRATRDGRHLQCHVEAGGSRSKAIGFEKGFLLEKVKSSPQWDVVFKLEQNEYNGSVSPQLKLKDLFPHEHPVSTSSGLCVTGCNIDCPDRVTGDEFWSMVRRPLLLPGAGDNSQDGVAKSLFPAGRLIDRRSLGGIHGQITMLGSCGESMLLLCSDVARRRNLVDRELTLASANAPRVVLASSRCGMRPLDERLAHLDTAEPVIVLSDFATALTRPELTGSFEHVVFIDPPLNNAIFSGVASAAGEAFIHLFYCADEVQFTTKVLEHEYNLREPLKKIYRLLKAGKRNLLDEATEKLLLSGGKYLRQPGIVARCINILDELGLIRFEEENGAVEIILIDAGEKNLDESPVFLQVSEYYEGCSRFLSKSLDAKMI